MAEQMHHVDPSSVDGFESFDIAEVFPDLKLCTGPGFDGILLSQYFDVGGRGNFSFRFMTKMTATRGRLVLLYVETVSLDKPDGGGLVVLYPGKSVIEAAWSFLKSSDPEPCGDGNKLPVASKERLAAKHFVLGQIAKYTQKCYANFNANHPGVRYSQNFYFPDSADESLVTPNTP